MWHGLAALTPAASRSVPGAVAAAPLAAAFLALLVAHPCAADPRGDQAFYQQLIDMSHRSGYVPTRTFTLVPDENGGGLVADDDPQLQFNLLWLDQHQPGYRVREGGAAFGNVVRSFLKSAWKNYRNANAQRLAGAPDENGAGSLRSRDVDYRLRWSDDEVTIGFEYQY